MDAKAKHILILSNAARTLVRFRGPLIMRLIEHGHRVTAAADEPEDEVTRVLSGWGVDFLPVALGRTRMNPLADFGALATLVALIRGVRPEVFFGYTIKPVVYGLLAARLAGVPRRVAMITGLGYAFTEGSGAKRRVARLTAMTAYRMSLRFADRVIFQNPDDQTFFIRQGLVRRTERMAVVDGSGVDLAYYAPAPMPDGPISFLMIARLLRDKGVYEFVEAARIVRRTYPEARFILVGRLDSNPAAVSSAALDRWVGDGLIEYRGELRDVRSEIAASQVYVLPSYREGMPRTVLEAMAMGRAIITTDVPGCRQTVVHDSNGLLVPPRDAAALAEAMMRLASDHSLRMSAGIKSRALCQSKFDSRAVASHTAALVEGEG